MNNLMAKRKTSRQKEKPHGKKNNLTGNWKEKPHGKKKKTHGRKRLTAKIFLPWAFFFLPWGFSFCREFNAFAMTVVGHHTTVRQTTSNWSLTLVWNILILIFVFFVFNTARIGPYCNTKPKSLFLEHYYSSGVGGPSIWSCAPNILNSAPKISAMRLKIYTWSHKCSQSQK